MEIAGDTDWSAFSWLVALLLDAHDALNERCFTLCGHTALRPAIIFAERPGQAVCVDCAIQAAATDGRLCALCAVPLASDAEYARYFWGEIVFSFQWCPRCWSVSGARSAFEGPAG
ncbi:hypothetical protein [Streptomyces sp. NPDC019539]|uniref:hypothetical protein n=1 Tax=Streptomyces sp. NPDC019539 TaxID=3365063 RepID=UPI0037B7DC90